MRKSTVFAVFMIVTLLVPGLAIAATDTAASTDPATPTTNLVTAITAMIVALSAFVGAIAGVFKAKKADAKATKADEKAVQAKEAAVQADAKATKAEERAQTAMNWADKVANAHMDGVVLVLSYPGTMKTCRGLLEINNWRVQFYSITQAELDAGKLLPGPHVIDDVKVADAIVVEGLNEEHMNSLSAVREFRDNIRSGAGVALYTGGQNVRYELKLWGDCDQGATTPVTTEAAVRASLARREATARSQGVRPGKLAEARKELVGDAN